MYSEGEVNMQRSAIEYLACARMGKLHERVLLLDAEGYQLQVPLLRSGFERGEILGTRMILWWKNNKDVVTAYSILALEQRLSLEH